MMAPRTSQTFDARSQKLMTTSRRLTAIAACTLAATLALGHVQIDARPQSGGPTPSSSGGDAVSPADLARLRAYEEHLADVTATLPRGVSLARILGPMLAFAGSRSTPATADEENRTALMATAFYVKGWPIDVLAPEARDWRRPRPRGVVLADRGDLAEHFALSALLSAASGQALADWVGLYKELTDAHATEGFSFSDLAADRAGSQLGRAATDPVSAATIQKRAVAGLSESDILPVIDDLPGDLSDAELTRRFGGIGAPAYNAMIARIEREVAALPLYK
jgi:hypothetical protein